MRKFVPGGFLEQYDGERYDGLIGELQYLESVPGFTGELERIRWDAPTKNPINENEPVRNSALPGSLGKDGYR